MRSVEDENWSSAEESSGDYGEETFEFDWYLPNFESETRERIDTEIFEGKTKWYVFWVECLVGAAEFLGTVPVLASLQDRPLFLRLFGSVLFGTCVLMKLIVCFVTSSSDDFLCRLRTFR